MNIFKLDNIQDKQKRLRATLAGVVFLKTLEKIGLSPTEILGVLSWMFHNALLSLTGSEQYKNHYLN